MSDDVVQNLRHGAPAEVPADDQVRFRIQVTAGINHDGDPDAETTRAWFATGTQLREARTEGKADQLLTDLECGALGYAGLLLVGSGPEFAWVRIERTWT